MSTKPDSVAISLGILQEPPKPVSNKTGTIVMIVIGLIFLLAVAALVAFHCVKLSSHEMPKIRVGAH